MKECNRCGRRPVHEDAMGSYCLPCNVRNGHDQDHFTKIDHDLLRALVGRDVADRVMRECRWDVVEAVHRARG